MINQIAGFDNIAWIFGIGLMFGLGFLLNWYLKGNMKTFFVLLLFFAGFMVSAELLEAWVMILLIILNVIMLSIEIKQNRGFG